LAVLTTNTVLAALVIAGAWLTVRVNVWVTAETTFVARKLMTYVPPVPAAGVPDSTPVVELKVTPEGRVPVSERAGVGKPVAVTVKLPSEPVVKVTLFALVIAGAWFTVSVNDWVEVPVAFVAVKLTWYTPLVPDAGVPERTPVAALKVTPEGRVPDSEYVAARNPVEVTVNVPLEPTTNVVLFALVIAGASLTVKVND